MGTENRKDEPEGVGIGSEVGSKERLPEKAIAVTNCIDGEARRVCATISFSCCIDGNKRDSPPDSPRTNASLDSHPVSLQSSY
jgi:hypothetical protein